MDGTFAFSRSVSLDLQGGTTSLTVYPNPAGDLLNIPVNDPAVTSVYAEINFYNGKQKIGRQLLVNQGKAMLDTGSLPSGMYLLSVYSAGRKEIFKFSKR